ncbi:MULTISPECIES: carboxylating nicotinate-nucleotide diphosphorylase [Agrobacterium tumefaciens complex]|jgi:nicotinate-nucleotide pyrophosphorylase (carboxylating)|uniref:Probable nicotinate-nucleotide pyrophosphorylase [carboxylating] n=1 Tax=Agrobacterium radiobacter TaxID=362 RepID=A0ABD5LNF5_AGRRD|nr:MULTISPECIES: carboxylating nicotinate-nucleotide diphosphorylase [Agrobacterium tumefaciens complex]MCP2136579.1 nicotinate-nucleotide pyrophosphorylase (carboxylating) [Rhizobium sp. SLBN-94]KAA1233396.1 carboxylating nicotinate-nucleotide diphosphorylase [Agrobacterium tumefaciens]KAB0457434.1 carboxylating nicotinate-nucleotide diphosphorylase [Agrobacterium tumefaciens]KWT75115.1 nicotinate-nucleotide pyrophosphorylase [Agrobacterium radiobacter]NIB12893.1 carboxylating nicotinate-nucl
MILSPLPRLIIEPLVRNALLEDLGLAGDITSAAVIPADHRSVVVMAAREPGVIAGLDAADLAFQLVDPAIAMKRHVQDGATVAPGDIIATIEGPSRGLLTAERTALNFLGHLSGIASVTAKIVAAIAGSKASVACTRKTTPGLRALEKYAVRAGGGMNHRFALYDAVLIKDNHIAVAGGVREAIRRARQGVGHLVKIEVEVDTLAQLRDVMDEGVDAVLLDNMTPEQLREAVGIVAGRAITEASGRINPQTAAAIAATGIDLISVGWLTHSAPVLDIGLDFESQG